ncbi:actin family [Pilaira anomala]|nr:actin family [Pilaira anomala]
MTEVIPIVMDNGSGTCKIGFAGEKTPRLIFPSVVGQSHNETYVVGAEALTNKEITSLKYPIQQGIITDWDNMEKIWDYAFHHKLTLSPNNEHHPVLLTEDPFNPKPNREKMFQIMFEKFNVPASYVSIPAVLSLYASGLTTGLVLDSGDDTTYVFPIFEGEPLYDASVCFEVAGRNITDALAARLAERGGHSFVTISQHEVVRDMKEKLCYVAFDYELEIKEDDIERSYMLPDGQVITVGNECFSAPEALFKPNLIGFESTSGIHEIIYNTIMKCDVDIHQDLYSQIVLAGGNTMLDGFADRLHMELSLLTPSSTKIEMIAPSDRMFSAWTGGSSLASLSTFENMWITAEEYQEFGASIIHRKCVFKKLFSDVY